jgi:hypothetical protein
VDDGVAVQVEARRARPVEHVDLRRVANAEERSLQGDRIVDAQASNLGLADRRGELVVCHDLGDQKP